MGWPGWYAMLPPWARTIAWLIDKPMPVLVRLGAEQAAENPLPVFRRDCWTIGGNHEFHRARIDMSRHHADPAHDRLVLSQPAGEAG